MGRVIKLVYGPGTIFSDLTQILYTHRHFKLCLCRLFLVNWHVSRYVLDFPIPLEFSVYISSVDVRQFMYLRSKSLGLEWFLKMLI